MLEKGAIVFDNWIVEDKIGSGAFGTVYRIRKDENGVEYRSALKVITIPPENSEVLSLKSEGMTKEEISAYYSEIADSFMDETKLLEELKGNPNIVGYEDSKIERADDGMSFTIMIKMELLTPLKSLLAERKLTEEEVLKLGVDMCTALEVCESKKIIHRDIKPDNIFVSNSGDYKLGDFGVARTLEKTVGVMSQKGTYTYMAPEVFLGKEYNQNVDLYSLGILLYQLLNENRTPFLPPAPQPIRFADRENAQKKRMSGNLLPWIKTIPNSWNALLVKMCHPDPKIRFQNATEVKVQINKILAMGKDYSLRESINPNAKPVAYNRTSSANSPSAAPVSAPVQPVRPVQSVQPVRASQPIQPMVNGTPAGYGNVNNAQYQQYQQSQQVYQPQPQPQRYQQTPVNNRSYAPAGVGATVQRAVNNQQVSPTGGYQQYGYQGNYQGQIYQPNLYNQPVQPVVAQPAQSASENKSYIQMMRNECSSLRYMLASLCCTLIFTVLNLEIAPDMTDSDPALIILFAGLVVLGIVRLSNYIMAKRGEGFLNLPLLYVFMAINNYAMNALYVGLIYISDDAGSSTAPAVIVVGLALAAIAMAFSFKKRNTVTYVISKICFVIASLCIMTVCAIELM